MMDMERAIAAANHAMVRHLGRHLSDVETEILKGSWQGQTYDQIASASGYSDSYLRRDVGTKFWKALGLALEETVSKNNFKEALRRYANQVLPPEPAIPVPAMSSDAEDLSVAGTVANDSYIERTPLETLCHNTLCQPGSLVRVKAPSLMGKTLLMDRVLTQLEARGLRTVRLSLELADRQVHFSSLNRFLRWLCINITRSLALPNELDDYWDEEGMGSKVSCSTYVEEYLLASGDAPLVLCLDDIDLLFPYPKIYEDFFSLLRSWYEMARTRSRPLWKQLRLAIVHSTDVYIQLNINQSPFNVGVPIELTEFTPEQTRRFAQLHGLSPSLELAPLMAMVGGHPYLLEQAFDYLNAHPHCSLDALLAEAPTETGIYANHLREHWINLRDNPVLTDTLRQVVKTSKSTTLESVQAHQLHSMGVIRLTGNIAEPRCQLYRQYFQTQLGVG
ncbi:AAA-like domain-containing protein [Leptothoe spongobia]|uniref:AAA-like domain-containing protein n=1 Tax=Leptothoe spongobia TAU-MAC 1115 TaxID=1967444 RepID=A0A947GQ55_9CYAN|nr:AAA-like domain-containing protein [Leptothoe spongobia]MBT9316901.1 AAA-like domain-containing protein [Leptothoe spongobia TAU-MAC 1115]